MSPCQVGCKTLSSLVTKRYKKPLFLEMISYNDYGSLKKQQYCSSKHAPTTQKRTETKKIASQPYQCDELGCAHLPNLCLQIQQSLCLRFRRPKRPKARTPSLEFPMQSRIAAKALASKNQTFSCCYPYTKSQVVPDSTGWLWDTAEAPAIRAAITEEHIIHHRYGSAEWTMQHPVACQFSNTRLDLTPNCNQCLNDRLIYQNSMSSKISSLIATKLCMCFFFWSWTCVLNASVTLGKMLTYRSTKFLASTKTSAWVP